MEDSKKKICFVVQRYGLEVNGGAELQCRLFAEHMLEAGYEVHVITTKAVDYMTWKNEYTEDTETINGVVVHRFATEIERKKKKFDFINRIFLTGLLPKWAEKYWFKAQGPYSPELVEYIKENRNNYDAFIFSTYLYYPTVEGMNYVKDKAIFIPEAHEEPMIYLNALKKVFEMPQAYFFNTDEERVMANKHFDIKNIPYEIGGIGIDKLGDVSAERFKEKYGLDRYYLYVGRIEQAKNCELMFEYFNKYKKDSHDEDIKLVLIGKECMDIPESDDIIKLGFVSDEDKNDAMAGAVALLMPSKFESLSMVVLEAMSLNTPVLVNGECEVLRGHCKKSKGAFYYYSYEEFLHELNYINHNTDDMNHIKKNACEYVENNYSWDAIVRKLSKLINLTIKEK
ncbi:Glycosyltransferase involved in cell wall bisynthesis [Pseudobutyrivibrio sp. NOR37]|uniref:Glycosyltransferase family 4 protein n=1 Tax=Pseudobutyrivibrio xylanivorans TaxID=185007 RepID=A0A6M0LIJ8_PSEXY|nr:MULTISPECIES: glycosyltransferase family 4 protein [Pseudobutyrivibrio]NEX02294.1 glycosyltransferase family 4 protein [Pseudobutyrivibrio xylanivorans]SFR77839.1 Glycosyltransferase involved in cell wall bisynthesis [Pseudobutyrivibrio sp. NOR37]